MKRFSVVAILIVAFLLPVSTAQATPLSTIFTDSVTFDDGGLPYTIFFGTLGTTTGSSGNTLISATTSAPTRSSQAEAVVYHGTLESVTFRYNAANSVINGMGYSVVVRNAANTIIFTEDVGSPGYTYPAGTEGTWTQFPDVPVGVSCANLCKVRVRIGDSTSGGTRHHWLDDIEMEVDATSNPFEPLAPTTDQFQPITLSSQFDVYHTTDGFGDPTSASRITALVTDPPLFPDEVQVYASISGVVESVEASGFGAYNVTLAAELSIPGVGINEYAVFINNLSRVYVQEGDSVTAGCVIGLAGPVLTPVDLEGNPSSIARQIFFSFYNRDDLEFVDWTEFDYPSGDTLCSLSSSDCLNRNATLTDSGDMWTRAPGSNGVLPSFNTAGVLLPPGASVSQHLALSEAGEYDVTVVFTPVLTEAPDSVSDHVTGHIEAQLGNVEASEPFDTIYAHTGTVIIGPLDPTSPSILPDIYELRITNPSSTYPPVSLQISLICLTETGATAPPGACYFIDPNFDDGAGWTLTDAFIKPIWAPFDDQGSMLALEPDGTAETTFNLSGYDTADASYRITIWTNGSTIDPDQHSLLNVIFDASDPSGDFTNEIDIDPGLVELGVWSRESFVYTVPEGETYSGAFILENATEEGVTPFDLIGIDSICLEPTNGTWPNYESQPPIPYVPASCTTVPTSPLASDAAAWTAWVGALIRFFWTCRVPGYVNSLLAAIYGVQNWLAMLGRWFAVVFYYLWSLMWDMTQWGVYTSQNLMVEIVEEIWSVSSGAMTLPWNGFSLLLALLWTAFVGALTLLWTLLMALISLAWTLFIALFTLAWGAFSTLAVAFWTALINLPLIDLFALGAVITELLFTIIAQVLSLIVTAFGILVTMAQIVGVFFTSIQLGFNDTTAVDVGMIDCVSMLTSDPLYGVCLAFDLSEYVIDAFPILTVGGVIIMGLVGYNTLRKTIDWYRQAFSEAS